jgi:hypothetical protein
MTHTLIASRAAKMLARISAELCETLVFIRPGGSIDCCPAHVAKAGAIISADRSQGYIVVGIYNRGVTIDELIADIRDAEL